MTTALLLLSLLYPQDWPQFRGPDGQGHAEVKSLPLKWSNSSPNIQWKVGIRGKGWSSPVIAEGRIWLTTATMGGRSLRVICLDVETGRQILDIEVFKRPRPGKIHRKNSHASPTPILSGGRIFVHFGTYGTACLSRRGGVIWENRALTWFAEATARR